MTVVGPILLDLKRRGLVESRLIYDRQHARNLNSNIFRMPPDVRAWLYGDLQPTQDAVLDMVEHKP